MNPEQLKPEYERVFTVTEYYDGPRKGIANFLGVPHLYECLFDEAKGNFSDQFLLTPIDTQTFQLAMEDWNICMRQRNAPSAREASVMKWGNERKAHAWESSAAAEPCRSGATGRRL